MKSPLLERIDARLAELQLTDNAACEKAGIQRDTIRDLRCGKRRSLTGGPLKKLAAALGTTVDWLMSDAIHDDARTVVPIDDVERFVPPPPDRRTGAVAKDRPFTATRSGAIPEIQDRAGAGDGTLGHVVQISSGGIQSGHVVAGEWLFPVDATRHWIGVDPRRSIIMQVKGDSMEPTLRGNDRVIVDLADQVPSEPAIYVIDEGHGPMIKRVRILAGSDPLMLQISSDNPLSGRWTREADAVRVIGRVRGRLTVF